MLVQRIADFAEVTALDARSLLPAVEQFMVGLAAHDSLIPCAAMVQEHLASGGKRLRAMLALDAVAALGGDPRLAVPWAAACELMHNASIVHDDVQDGDRVRRGHAALWTRWGAHQAINAGDLMLMLPTLCLDELQVSGEVKWHLARCVAGHGAQTAHGQASEMQLRQDCLIDSDAYLRAAMGKTGGLFGMPVEGAALVMGRTPEQARQIGHTFELLGLLFQLQDDIIDLYGDKGRGAAGADLREGKVSALIVAHAECRPDEILWLHSILRMPSERLNDVVVESVAQRFRQSGALAQVMGKIEELERDIRESIRVSEPALAPVCDALLSRIMAPIHGLSDVGGGG